MIISWISGGLGNQMFQYALGHVLSDKNNDIHKLDLSSYQFKYKIDTPRSYGLSVFGIGDIQASEAEIKRLSQPNRLPALINRYLSTGLPTYPRSYFREHTFRYMPEVLNMRGDTYLYGYWQSWKYFRGYEELIRRSFTFKRPLKAINQKLQSGMSDTSVAIHVRRGDYVHNKNTHAVHGICDAAYYAQAVSYIRSKLDKSKFYVFSDDIPWCKEYLKLPPTTVYINHNKGVSSWQDMQLISSCAHTIIANSSFSWWGAWLNANPSKLVIAPSTWFKDKTINTTDLIPDTWTKI